MTENERELIRIIRESKNPEKVMAYMAGIIIEFLTERGVR